ncbi:MAG: glycosyltransferase [Proteobacteria bacterium]|nr:MAG: glycosyltransferase [Pseudomonadota bacterium]
MNPRDKKWRVLVVHGYYQQRGGEDTVFETETAAMEDAGWAVDRLVGRNDDLEGLPKHVLAAKSVWNREWERKVRDRIREFRPEIVHFHNTFPMISPSAIWTAKREGVPVVQTLHNFRLGCLNGVLFRDGEVCTDCLGRTPLLGVRRGCYRGRSASAVAAVGLQTHRLIGTYRHIVDRFIVLTEASKELYLQMGLPAEKLVVKPNFLYPDPPIGSGQGGYAMFAGRLSVEKGIHVLLKTWRSDPRLPLLKIVGDGPVRSDVDAAAKELPNLEVLGARPREEVAELLRGAECLVMPSVWYEGCPMVMVEALASGTPVVASDFPTLRELIGDSGEFFAAGDSAGLSEAIRSNFSHNRRQSARQRHQSLFSAASSLERLGALYAELYVASPNTIKEDQAMTPQENSH